MSASFSASDNTWMLLALKQAKIAQNQGEVPVGAVLVKDNVLIAAAHNQPRTCHDPSAHAEIQLLRASGQVLHNYRLPETTLYVTLEPCAMCLGAMIHARIARVVFAAFDLKTGACGSCFTLTNAACFNHKPHVVGGLLALESQTLLKQFFKMRRASKKVKMVSKPAKP